MPPVDETTLSVGQTVLGKLRVEGVVGVGGMGVVYRVTHLMTRHERALKVLRSHHAESATAVSRFLREATVAGTLRTPHVVETFDAGQLEDGSPYVLMELLDGEPLSAVIARRASAGRIVSLVWQACEGLAVAHAAGIVHRDLKPENLFVVRDARGDETVKLLDFGVSKFRSRPDEVGTLTGSGEILGTPYYMSPEQVSGRDDVDARTDVYALGVILYEAFAGKRPFVAETFPALFVRIHEGDHEPLRTVAPGVSQELAAVVERAMHRDREERWQSVGALADALRPFADREMPERALVDTDAEALAATVASTAPPSGARPGRGERARWVVPIVSLAAVAAIAGSIAIAVGESDGEAETRSERDDRAVAPAGEAEALPRGLTTPELPVDEAALDAVDAGRAQVDEGPARPPAVRPPSKGTPMIDRDVYGEP